MRSHPPWLAFLTHRLSGLALALFLPVHFRVLALALTAPDKFDRYLSLAEYPLVKLSEFALVFLLALHAFGGLRPMEQVLAQNVEQMQEHRAVGLVPSRDGSALASVLMIDMRRGLFRLVRARAVLMATGREPTMYRYHTPSGDKSMNGLATALRGAGGRLLNPAGQRFMFDYDAKGERATRDVVSRGIYAVCASFPGMVKR
ncbi:FAD-binding protein [Ruegeria marina]|uniref:Succinate dehydrogenase, cytochrome b556 subunit n=1 Tax=Ruegeria marina TaxID=639004 RepID=A0A1G6QP02_9RHOB|nr:succinate dehydrogenase, cytochrome b556 subunit [Ruegeria marina]